MKNENRISASSPNSLDGYMAASKLSAWFQAIRLRTLPLATASILLGNLIAFKSAGFSWAVAILSYITAIFLQILSNLANDYGDTKHGADNVERIGPKRMTQAGLLSAASIKAGIFVFIVLSLLSGSLLLFLALKNITYTGLISLFILGLISIAAAVAYTATKKPYGYRGLGDISVFIFFGLLSVFGCYFLQTGEVDPVIFFPAAGMGLLCTAVLNINNIRDIESDRKAGKKTVALQLEEKGAKLYQWSLIVIAILLFSVFFLIKNTHSFSLLFLLPYLLLLLNTYKVWKSKSSIELNPRLKQLAISILLFSVSYSIGLNY